MQQYTLTTNHTFRLEQHPQKKGVCPKCQKKDCFRYYALLPRDYGICDHANSCGYHNSPGKQSLEIKKELYKMIDNTMTVVPKSEPKIIYPSPEYINKLLQPGSTNFNTALKAKLGITDEHLYKWGIGAENNYTCFIVQNKEKILNVKKLLFTPNCKRDKNKTPFYLKAEPNTKYSRCLFGEHLLTDKIICLVESEKTAVIASFFYPQFDWLATGSANGLTDSLIDALYNRQIYYLNDADTAGRDNSTIKKLKAYKLNYKVVDLYPERNDGSDLADYIFEGLRPEIKPIETLTNVASQKAEVKKNISDYERVEIFINERYEIRNNVISNKIEFRPLNTESKEFRELNENNIFRELQKNFINFSINKLKSLLGSEFVKEYNPFVHYFENLPVYDPAKEPDYILKLLNYIPVRDKQRFEVQFRKMLVRCIACSLYNVVNKQAFILVHDQQNSGKTTFLRWINPPDLKGYIAENINTDKDSLIAMCTNFIINMDELATLNKAEINALKSIMSKDVFKGRLPYGAREVNLIRRANIVGSTNNVEFLSDETGSVRWLCFELTDKLNFNYNKDIDINKIWAQAYYLYNTGFKYELTANEIVENEVANANHRIITIEQELIHASFEPGQKGEPDSIFKTAASIKLQLNEKYPSERLNPNMIGKALKVLGYDRVSEKPPNYDHSIKGYYVKTKINY